jgi:ABC-2 type transport system permease protein
VFDVYGFFIVSGFQVPALSLLSSMAFLLPLLVAIAAAELLGIEIQHGTLPTVLLRPVTRSQWMLAKVLVASASRSWRWRGSCWRRCWPARFGFGPFVGGTGARPRGLLGRGHADAPRGVGEVGRAYLIAAYALVPIALLSVLFAVLFMNAAAGALATLASLIVMELLVVFPALTPYLLTSQLSAYVSPAADSAGSPP